MLKIDLITGFLGAGKTTFIHKYLDFLKRNGVKAAIIENEFGCADVDARLLQDTQVPIRSLTGVCMCCRGKSMFQNMIISAAKEGYDRLLVEPSGIYDVDEFFSTMMDQEVRSLSEIGSIITIVDAIAAEPQSDAAGYLRFSQILSAGVILLSKTQMASMEEIESVKTQLHDSLLAYGCTRVLKNEDLLIKCWDDFTDADFQRISSAGYRLFDHKREALDHQSIFQAFPFASYCRGEADLSEKIHQLFSDVTPGRVCRVKGHIRDLSGNWYELNCTRECFSVRKVEIKRGLFMIIGEELDKRYLEALFIDKKSAR